MSTGRTRRLQQAAATRLVRIGVGGLGLWGCGVGVKVRIRVGSRLLPQTLEALSIGDDYPVPTTRYLLTTTYHRTFLQALPQVQPPFARRLTGHADGQTHGGGHRVRVVGLGGGAVGAQGGWRRGARNVHRICRARLLVGREALDELGAHLARVSGQGQWSGAGAGAVVRGRGRIRARDRVRARIRARASG